MERNENAIILGAQHVEKNLPAAVQEIEKHAKEGDTIFLEITQKWLEVFKEAHRTESDLNSAINKKLDEIAEEIIAKSGKFGKDKGFRDEVKERAYKFYDDMKFFGGMAISAMKKNVEIIPLDPPLHDDFDKKWIKRNAEIMSEFKHQEISLRECEIQLEKLRFGDMLVNVPAREKLWIKKIIKNYNKERQNFIGIGAGHAIEITKELHKNGIKGKISFISHRPSFDIMREHVRAAYAARKKASLERRRKMGLRPAKPR